MAREGISYDQVAKTADELVGDGQQPTIRFIRERLGTGSPNTIHRHLTAWREARPQITAAAPELPAALAAQIATEISRAAAQARAEIEGRLIQTQAEAAELAATGEALEIEHEALTEQVAALTRERDTLASKAAQQAADLIEQTTRIDREQQAAEAARIELATARLKIEAQAEKRIELSTENQQLRLALETSQQARQAAEQQAAVLAAKLEAMTDRATKAETRADKAEQNAQHSGEETAELRGRLTAAAAEIQKAKLKTKPKTTPTSPKTKQQGAEPSS
jgi:chromosome segregation ATPase